MRSSAGTPESEPLLSASSPLLLLLTCRPGFQPPWRQGAGLTQLRLEPLGDDETASLVDRLVGDGELTFERRERIAERACGIPLFLEELVREALGSGDAGDEGIPATLRDLLSVGLDRLGPAREILRILAARGPETSFEELAARAALDEESLHHELDRLAAAGVLTRSGDTLGWFRHELVREAAAAALLAEDRELLRSRA